MLTPRGTALIALAVAGWALGRFLGVDELYVVSAASLAMLGLAVASTRVSSTRIAVRRTTGWAHAHHREPVPIGLQMRNDGRLAASLLLVEDRRPAGIESARHDGPTIRFVIPGLRPQRVVDLQWEAVGIRRGRYTIGPVRIRLRDPFGLAERTRRYRTTDDVVVYPAIESLAVGDGRGIRQGAEASAVRRAFHRGEEFYTMRTYVVGDDLRHVHWPSTAHRGALMVRQHELPWTARAAVYLDCRAHLHRGTGPRGTFERGVSAAASLLIHLRDLRYDLRLITDGTDRPDAAGGIEQALVRLAEISTTSQRSPVAAMSALEQAGDGLLVAVLRPPPDDIELVDHPEVRALLQAGRGYRARVALVIEHHDTERCDTLARLLALGGWHTAVAAPDEPLAQAWQRAAVSASVLTVGAR